MRNVGLALQGGGAYAAFTGGVLESMFDSSLGLLEQSDIHSVTGTSGGALNAALLGAAIHEKQADPAIYVRRLWEINRLEKLLRDRLMIPEAVPDSLIAFFIGMGRSFNSSNPFAASVMSQYSKQSSLALDIIHDILRHTVSSFPDDFDKLLFPSQKPFVTVVGTEVKSAQAHYFTNNEQMINDFQRLNISKRYNIMKSLTLRGVYASLAHPNLFNSVKMGDDIYWDGYFTSNPPFFYLLREGCDEIFLVRLIQRNRENVGDDLVSVKDRAEEIIQNNTLNLEIQMYLLMRELLLKNSRVKELSFKLGARNFTKSTVYHEIRLLKSGNISDEGYPLAGLVDKLTRLGRKVMGDRQGFINTYRNREPGKNLQVISEVRFEDEDVHSFAIDTDHFVFADRFDLGYDGAPYSVKNRLWGMTRKISTIFRRNKHRR